MPINFQSPQYGRAYLPLQQRSDIYPVPFTHRHARRCALPGSTGPPMDSTPRPPASRLEERLRARQFVITAEITPPVSCSADDLLEKARPLRGLVDAVNVTDGASARAHMSAPIAAAILAREGHEPVLQLTCRDRNRLALEAELMGAAAAGMACGKACGESFSRRAVRADAILHGQGDRSPLRGAAQGARDTARLFS